MNVLKMIIIGTVAIIVLVLIVALFVKKEYKIQREITVSKPAQEVFDYLKRLRNQDYYNKWIMMDPDMKKEFKGIDGTVGFVYAWDGNDKAGKGEQEITGIREGSALDLEIRFKKPFEGIARTQMLTQTVGPNQTRVIWSMAGQSKYPMNLTNLFTDKLLGKDLETSLIHLKAILEK